MVTCDQPQSNSRRTEHEVIRLVLRRGSQFVRAGSGVRQELLQTDQVPAGQSELLPTGRSHVLLTGRRVLPTASHECRGSDDDHSVRGRSEETLRGTGRSTAASRESCREESQLSDSRRNVWERATLKQETSSQHERHFTRHFGNV